LVRTKGERNDPEPALIPGKKENEVGQRVSEAGRDAGTSSDGIFSDTSRGYRFIFLRSKADRQHGLKKVSLGHLWLGRSTDSQL